MFVFVFFGCERWVVVAKKKRKPIKTETKGNYVIEDYKNPPKKEIKGYRTVKKDGHLIKVAIMKNEGPRGGRTKVTSIWHPKNEFKQDKKKGKKKK